MAAPLKGKVSIQDIGNDPEFHSLPREEQINALKLLLPQFNKLDNNSMVNVVAQLEQKYKPIAMGQVPAPQQQPKLMPIQTTQQGTSNFMGNFLQHQKEVLANTGTQIYDTAKFANKALTFPVAKVAELMGQQGVSDFITQRPAIENLDKMLQPMFDTAEKGGLPAALAGGLLNPINYAGGVVQASRAVPALNALSRGKLLTQVLPKQMAFEGIFGAGQQIAEDLGRSQRMQVTPQEMAINALMSGALGGALGGLGNTAAELGTRAGRVKKVGYISPKKRTEAKVELEQAGLRPDIEVKEEVTGRIVPKVDRTTSSLNKDVILLNEEFRTEEEAKNAILSHADDNPATVINENDYHVKEYNYRDDINYYKTVYKVESKDGKIAVNRRLGKRIDAKKLLTETEKKEAKNAKSSSELGLDVEAKNAEKIRKKQAEDQVKNSTFDAEEDAKKAIRIAEEVGAVSKGIYKPVENKVTGKWTAETSKKADTVEAKEITTKQKADDARIKEQAKNETAEQKAFNSRQKAEDAKKARDQAKTKSEELRRANNHWRRIKTAVYDDIQSAQKAIDDFYDTYSDVLEVGQITPTRIPKSDKYKLGSEVEATRVEANLADAKERAKVADEKAKVAADKAAKAVEAQEARQEWSNLRRRSFGSKEEAQSEINDFFINYGDRLDLDGVSPVRIPDSDKWRVGSEVETAKMEARLDKIAENLDIKKSKEQADYEVMEQKAFNKRLTTKQKADDARIKEQAKNETAEQKAFNAEQERQRKAKIAKENKVLLDKFNNNVFGSKVEAWQTILSAEARGLKAEGVYKPVQVADGYVIKSVKKLTEDEVRFKAKVDEQARIKTTIDNRNKLNTAKHRLTGLLKAVGDRKTMQNRLNAFLKEYGDLLGIDYLEVAPTGNGKFKIADQVTANKIDEAINKAVKREVDQQAAIQLGRVIDTPYTTKELASKAIKNFIEKHGSKVNIRAGDFKVVNKQRTWRVVHSGKAADNWIKDVVTGRKRFDNQIAADMELMAASGYYGVDGNRFKPVLTDEGDWVIDYKSKNRQPEPEGDIDAEPEFTKVETKKKVVEPEQKKPVEKQETKKQETKAKQKPEGNLEDIVIANFDDVENIKKAKAAFDRIAETDKTPTAPMRMPSDDVYGTYHQQVTPEMVDLVAKDKGWTKQETKRIKDIVSLLNKANDSGYALVIDYRTKIDGDYEGINRTAPRILTGYYISLKKNKNSGINIMSQNLDNITPDGLIETRMQNVTTRTPDKTIDSIEISSFTNIKFEKQKFFLNNTKNATTQSILRHVAAFNLHNRPDVNKWVNSLTDSEAKAVNNALKGDTLTKPQEETVQRAFHESPEVLKQIICDIGGMA